LAAPDLLVAPVVLILFCTENSNTCLFQSFACINIQVSETLPYYHQYSDNSNSFILAKLLVDEKTKEDNNKSTHTHHQNSSHSNVDIPYITVYCSGLVHHGEMLICTYNRKFAAILKTTCINVRFNEVVSQLII
jgi:hypothetical protein